MRGAEGGRRGAMAALLMRTVCDMLISICACIKGHVIKGRRGGGFEI